MLTPSETAREGACESMIAAKALLTRLPPTQTILCLTPHFELPAIGFAVSDAYLANAKPLEPLHLSPRPPRAELAAHTRGACERARARARVPENPRF